MSQTERLYWIDSRIRAGRFPNADAVCREFGVARRTAFTDRDHLMLRLGAPLMYDRRRGGWAYTDSTYVLPFLALSERESGTLSRSLLAAHEYLPPAEAEAVRSLARRLQPFVPPLSDPAAETVAGASRLAGGISASSALLEDCRRAIRGRSRLRLLYYSAHRDVLGERVVRPFHLHHWRGEPYLIAWCEWRQGLRHFFLGRIRECETLNASDSFPLDPSFDAQAYLARGLAAMHGERLVTVRVRFTPYQARWVRERRYHDSQETEELADGGLLLTLRVAGTYEIRRWLLGFGAEAEVLEPEGLRREMAAEAEKMAKSYHDG